MSDPFPHLPLAYEQGWIQFFNLADYTDMVQSLNSWVALTQQRCSDKWARDTELVRRHWQVILEEVSLLAISEDDREEMSEIEIIETAMITVQTNLEMSGWYAEGISFNVPELIGEDEAGRMRGYRDLMDVRSPQPVKL